MLYLEFARRNRGWTQTQLGQFVRIGPSFISLLELGRGIPTDDQLERLARALDLPPDLVLKPVVAAALPAEEPATSEAAR